MKSLAVTNNITGQNNAALLLLRIFLALLAVDAITRMGQRVESLESDLLTTIVTLAEDVRVAVKPPQRLVDVPEEAPLLAREEKRLLALHRIGTLIRHVEGIAAQIAVRRLRCVAERLVGATELLQHPTPLLQQSLLEMLKVLLRHRFRLRGFVRCGHCYCILVKATRTTTPSRSSSCMAP